MLDGLVYRLDKILIELNLHLNISKLEKWWWLVSIMSLPH